jgi:hypothetical protein
MTGRFLDGYDIDNPAWDAPTSSLSGSLFVWPLYVGERAKTLWGTFTPDQRLALAQDAADAASDALDVYADASERD